MFCNKHLTNSMKGRLSISNYSKLVRLRARQIVEMETRLEEETKALEEQKKCALEELNSLKKIKSKP